MEEKPGRTPVSTTGVRCQTARANARSAVGILVVDDSRAMRMIVLRELRRAGYETRDAIEAENGRVALDRLRQGGVHLVLSGWNMPEMNGITLLRALRREGIAVPFGFITSESTAHIHREALDAGADFVVTKPFSAETLSAPVEQALGGRRQADGLGAAVADEHGTFSTVLGHLLGRTVVTTPSEPPRVEVAGAIASYDGGAPGRRMLLVVELGLAASIAAAFCRLPAKDAETYISDGALPVLVEEDLYEVANVLSKVVPGYEERWTLETLTVLSVMRDLPELHGELNPLAWRGPMEVRITGYRSGRAAFLSVDDSVLLSKLSVPGA
jgi:two-component system, chemotaxis family, chemotaxis protein CheY